MQTVLLGGFLALVGLAWVAIRGGGPARVGRLLRAGRRGSAGSRVPGAPCALARDAVLRLPRRAGAVVRVHSGLVVVTRAGDPEDHVLQAGATLPLDRTGAVAWALEPSRVAILEERRVGLAAGTLAGEAR